MSDSLRDEWLEHEHTRSLLRDLQKRVEQLKGSVLLAAAKSADPEVRARFDAYVEAQRLYELMTQKEKKAG